MKKVFWMIKKKGVNLVVFVVVCIVCLTIGILIGYNVNKKVPEEQPKITVTRNVEEKKVEIVSIYNRLNASGEIYLYTLNSDMEEMSILDLTNSKYAYQYIDEDLYILLEKDGLSLYDYSFSKDGYHRELIDKFENDYDAFYFKNNLILIKNKDSIKIYSKEAILVNELKLDADQIYDYTSEYIIYAKDSKLNIYYIKTGTTKKLTKRVASFVYSDSDQVFYIEKNKLYKYSIIGDVLKELTAIKLNSIFTKVDNYYMFNDGKTLYTYQKEIKKIKDFEYNINEIANLNNDTIIFILEDYNINGCLIDDRKFMIYSVSGQYITEKNVSGCLNTQVVNGLINVK